MTPRDFFIDIIGFFAVLLPGAAATYALCLVDLDELIIPFDTGQPQRWVVFAFTSYLIGHLIFLVGSRLDPVYDRWRRRSKGPAEDRAFQAARALQRQLSPELTDSAFTTLKWARSYVALRAPAARDEIDGFEATSKFFRSLVVLFALAAVVSLAQLAREGDSLILLFTSLCLLLARLCFLRFCDQRWKFTELAYAYAILVANPAITGDTCARKDVSRSGAGAA